MYRVGIRELNSDGVRLPRRLYEQTSRNVRYIIDSYIGYFDTGQFIELLGHPQSFNALCAAASLEPYTTSSVTALLSILKDNSSLEYGFAVVGWVNNRELSLPKGFDRAAYDLGLPSSTADHLRRCSTLVGKVDNYAVQDGYRIWFHCMVFSRRGEWSIVQIGSRPSVNRVYHWFSERAIASNFVEEPHTGLISEASSKYVLDFTFRSNGELRSALIDVIKEPISKLRTVKLARPDGLQLRLTSFGDEENDAQSSEFNPLSLPVKVNWQVIEELRSHTIRNFTELLAWRKVGEQLLRFLAVCAANMYGVKINLTDRAQLINQLIRPVDPERVKGLIYDLMEAIKFSGMSKDAAKVAMARVSSYVNESLGY
ncbi:MAG: DUF763 domain-containing protein [Aigarchaeota archaeon]|nr:DUF763 domain-containing protein [Aigarchaeota archaeon]MDW8092620.1 DUF763 domain-containing protein [Nitrososphaerota archaeon]